MTTFQRLFTVGPQHIDELGHVNNAVWVQWIQDIAVAHWQSLASNEHRARYIWVVTRHEIDYRGNVGPGETVTGRTFVPTPPRGARFDRHVEFRDRAGKLLVASVSTWALIERSANRIVRVPGELARLFVA